MDRASGLCAEYPGEVADAAAASQFRETIARCLTAPRELDGGAWFRIITELTRHSDHGLRSPTVVDTTGSKPALDSVDEASPYRRPETSGGPPAQAEGIDATVTESAAHTAIAEAAERVDMSVRCQGRGGNGWRPGRCLAHGHPTHYGLGVDGIRWRTTRSRFDPRALADVDPAAVRSAQRAQRRKCAESRQCRQPSAAPDASREIVHSTMIGDGRLGLA
jgi:hypothetical protein